MANNGVFIVNPTQDQQDYSPLDLVIAGTADAILMIEGCCDFLTEEQMLEVCFSFPHCFIQEVT